MRQKMYLIGWMHIFGGSKIAIGVQTIFVPVYINTLNYGDGCKGTMESYLLWLIVAVGRIRIALSFDF